LVKTVPISGVTGAVPDITLGDTTRTDHALVDWCGLVARTETVPILNALRLRGDPREPPVRHAQDLCGDWPSLGTADMLASGFVVAKAPHLSSKLPNTPIPRFLIDRDTVL